ncbi:hypothetical protein BKA70DRAFT_1253660 [Coprinopsis sp. MPI-PUGE-AT-0042]|nr:hypothetical protein BKA70DRAFT_1253660 [Coprinopsis sp. MPI-PUGE-AT-0042]
MLRRLAPGAAKRRTVDIVLQTPRLPFEILYKVIDEQFAAESQAVRNAAIRDIGRTCRALASYCRTLSFHAISIRSQHAVVVPIDKLNPRKNFPERFTSLIQSYPVCLQVIRNLSLQFDERPRLSGVERLLSAIPGREKLRWGEWLGVMAAPYPQLRVLRLTLPTWVDLPHEIQEAVLNMLSRADHLESLELSVNGCPTDIIKFCPPTLRHLSYLREFDNLEGQTIGSTLAAPTGEGPALESFTFSGVHAHETIVEGLLSHERGGLLGHKSLKHIEVAAIGSAATFMTYCTLIEHSYSSLQCLHFKTAHFVYALGLTTESLPGIALGALPSLKLFEVGFHAIILTQGIHWLAGSVATLPAERPPGQLQDLLVMVVIQYRAFCPCCAADERIIQQAHTENQKSWDAIVERNPCPELNKANVVAFSEPAVVLGYNPGKPLLLGPYGGSTLSDGEVPTYSSLMASCFCTQKKYRFTDA